MKGDASPPDPKSDPNYSDALAGKNGHEAFANAMSARDQQAIRQAQSETGMTEAEFAQMEARAAPKEPHEFKFPDDVPFDQAGKVAAAQKAMFEQGVAQAVVNLYIQIGDGLTALPPDASAMTTDARAAALALPRGPQADAEAAEFAFDRVAERVDDFECSVEGGRPKRQAEYRRNPESAAAGVAD